MDINNPEMVKDFISLHKPDIIIHLAALASIPKCEENKTLAWNTNVLATRNIVKIAKDVWVKKFLYLQSACIFSWEDDFMYEYAKLGWSNVEKITLEEYSWIWLTRKKSLTTKYWHTYKIEDSDFNDN